MRFFTWEVNMSTYDILIVGGGIVGATAALALAKKTSLRIALIDSRKITSEWLRESHDYRVSAISVASQRIFRHLDVWDAIQAKRVCPYQKMQVWEAGGAGAIDFDCRSIQMPELGHIIEDAVMRSSLAEQFSLYPNLDVIAPLKLISFEETPEQLVVTANDGQRFSARLLIGADGGNSWIREQAALDVTEWDYAQRAIVTTVQTALPHQFTAWQRFLATGPLAFLPLADTNKCSIVWSTTPEEATRLLALDHVAFQQELNQAFGEKLGSVTATESRYSFHLQMRHVKNYVKPRLALIGDAAHSIHPMAGQGVNLGLLDAAALVDVITEALAKKRDFASLPVLRRYERWRKADNAMMLGFVEAIKSLFASETPLVARLRNTGMSMANRIDLMKSFFANYATGNRDDMPTLASPSLE
jgi:2-octaprenylphenol hydroxylase